MVRLDKHGGTGLQAIENEDMRLLVQCGIFSFLEHPQSISFSVKHNFGQENFFRCKLPKSSKLSLAIMRRQNQSFACHYSMTSQPSFPETEEGLWPGKNSLLTETWAKVIVSCPEIKQMCLQQGGLVPGLSTKQLFEAITSNPLSLFTANHSEFGKMIHKLSYKDCLEPDEGP